MKYTSKASSTSKSKASIQIKESEISFGITPETADSLPNPAELLLGSFSSCILKNVERFSMLMNFDYSDLLRIPAQTYTRSGLYYDFQVPQTNTLERYLCASTTER